MPVKLSSDDADDEPRIEIVPLIDIMFFLLASFMLVSLSMMQMHRVKVKLPQASTATQENKQPSLHIAVDANGAMTLEKQATTLTEIKKLLDGMSDKTQAKVLIATDQETRQKHLITLLDLLKANGIEQIGFEVAPMDRK